MELTMLDQLWEHLASIARQEELAKQAERIQLLQSIPGVGHETAEVSNPDLSQPMRQA